MVRIAIVEDDEKYVGQLRQYMQRYREETGTELTLSVFRDGAEILENYVPQYDLILMDIEMKLVDGMTAAEEIRRRDQEVALMFVTNMSQYAIRGYEVGALDYILKPVSYFAFSQKLTRAISKISNRKIRYVTIPLRSGYMRMAASDIYYIECQGHTLYFHTAKGVLEMHGTMKSAEETLKGLHFSRGNNGYLINLMHVEGIEDKCAVVKGEKLLLSRPRQKDFMQELTRYWGDIK